MTLTLLAPAKLNLFLHVTGRRSDGYHCLQTLFQLLDWGDTLRFTGNESGVISLDWPADDIPLADNLIIRAASALQPPGGYGMHIDIDKRIPAGGGLGGGSSDAATTLLALNHLWGLGHNSDQLQAIGATLGADVPVFVAGSSAWAEGTGELLTPVNLPSCWYLVVKPDCAVATSEIFSHSQLTRDSSPIKIAAFFEGDSRNDCQPIVRRLYPEVDNALNWLENFGEARLTGTGACIFARFESKEEAEAVKQQLPEGCKGYVARGINTSPVITTLS